MEQQHRNGLGIAAIVVAFCGVVFGLIPLTGFLAVMAGFTAVILGLAGRRRVKRGHASNGKTAASGVVVGLAALALGVWGMTIVFGAVEQFDQDMQEISDELDQDLAELEKLD